MFNRNLRTLSANLNRLNLGFGTRSFAAIADANDMVVCPNRIRKNSIGDQSPEPEPPHGETDAWPTDHVTDADQRHQRLALFVDRHGPVAVDRVSPVRVSTSLSTTTPTTRDIPDSIDSSPGRHDRRKRSLRSLLQCSEPRQDGGSRMQRQQPQPRQQRLRLQPRLQPQTIANLARKPSKPASRGRFRFGASDFIGSSYSYPATAIAAAGIAAWPDADADAGQWMRRRNEFGLR